MKVVTVLGARPQFIKAAAVSRLLRALPGVTEIFIHTGQHYDENMSGVFFSELEIPQPEYNLGVGSGSHGAQTGQMLELVEQVLLQEKPDRVLVYGDTNSTLAGALAAVKLHIPVAHVEAGLRSFNRRMPEEINRVLADHASELLFAPTEAAVRNLRGEGIPEERIKLVGDVMHDAALFYGAKAEIKSDILERLQINRKGYILATIHRAENTDEPRRLRAILGGLLQAAADISVIFPVHPRTRSALEREALISIDHPDLHMIDPVGYLDMVMLEKHARLIATDSGGVQKEAFFHGVPCVTLRDETEWVELVELGWNRIVPPRSEREVAQALLDSLDHPGGREGFPYGGGDAAAKVVQCLVEGVNS
ncbi:MAG: non-hydrolyzing UDP-N-acetylglucosamine 2-epimerase [Dethiobacteria bacterium]